MRTYTFISIAGVFHVSFFSSQEVIISTWRSGENSLPFQSKPLPRAAHPPSSCRLWGWTSKQTLNPHTTPFFIWFQGKSKKCDQRMALMKRTLFPLCSKSLAAWLCVYVMFVLCCHLNTVPPPPALFCKVHSEKRLSTSKEIPSKTSPTKWNQTRLKSVIKYI